MIRELIYAIRRLKRSPSFSISAIFTIGLSLGLSTTVFSLYSMLVLRPLAVPEPSQLAILVERDNNGQRSLPYNVYRTIRDNQTIFSGFFAYSFPVEVVEFNGQSEAMGVLFVTDGYFSTLKAPLFMGRGIGKEDVSYEGQPRQVAVIGELFWRDRLFSDPNIIGKQIRVGAREYQVIGVTASSFRGVKVGFPPNVTVPLAPPSARLSDNEWADAMARLKPGISLTAGKAYIDSIWPSLRSNLAATQKRQDGGKSGTRRLELHSGRNGTSFLRQKFAPSLQAVLIAAIIVVILACANLSIMLAAQMAEGWKNFGVRLALGATSWHILRVASSDGLILVGVGALVGFPIAVTTTKLLAALMNVGNTQAQLDLTPDPQVYLFTLIAAVSLVAVITVVPLVISRSATLMARGPRRKSVVPGVRILIALQVAGSMVLLLASIVTYRSLHVVLDNPLAGAKNTLLIQLLPVSGGYRNINISQYYRDILNAFNQESFVSQSGIISPVPFGGYTDRISVKARGTNGEIPASLGYISTDLMSVLSIPMSRGRTFVPSDETGTVKVGVVSESLARRLSITEEGNGAIEITNRDGSVTPVEIVGVMPNRTIYDIHSEIQEGLFLLWSQQEKASGYAVLALKTKGDSAPTVTDIHRVLGRFGRETTLWVRSVSEQAKRETAQERLAITAFLCFGLIGVSLTLAGLYGLMNFTVNNRRVDFAIRLALGAQRIHVVQMVITEAAAAISCGLLLGSFSGLGVVQLLRSVIFGVESLNWVAYIYVSLGFVALGCVAACMPIRTLMDLNASNALRGE